MESGHGGKFTSRGGRFNYNNGAPATVPPPPEPVVLGTDDFTAIETDTGILIEVV